MKKDVSDDDDDDGGKKQKTDGRILILFSRLVSSFFSCFLLHQQEDNAEETNPSPSPSQSPTVSPCSVSSWLLVLRSVPTLACTVAAYNQPTNPFPWVPRSCGRPVFLTVILAVCYALSQLTSTENASRECSHFSSNLFASIGERILTKGLIDFGNSPNGDSTRAMPGISLGCRYSGLQR